MKTTKTVLAGGFLIVAGFLLWASRGWGQTANAPRGVISGTVTANRDYALSEASGKHIPALYSTPFELGLETRSAISSTPSLQTKDAIRFTICRQALTRCPHYKTDLIRPRQVLS